MSNKQFIFSSWLKFYFDIPEESHEHHIRNSKLMEASLEHLHNMALFTVLKEQFESCYPSWKLAADHNNIYIHAKEITPCELFVLLGDSTLKFSVSDFNPTMRFIYPENQYGELISQISPSFTWPLLILPPHCSQ